MKVLERVVKSAGAPDMNDLWLDDSGEQLKLKVFHNGEWVEICCCECSESNDDDDIVITEDPGDGPGTINF